MLRTVKAWFLLRLDAHDRALFSRFALSPETRSPHRRAWLGVTHLGGATATIAAVLVPLAAGRGALRHGAVIAAWSLLVSHLVVQLVKRRAVRDRPATPHDGPPLANAPDRFSFPSGHSCAAMAVAFSYGMALPVYAAPLVLLAALVGVSRVRLGVHYPGDMFAGQAIALLTVLGVWAIVR